MKVGDYVRNKYFGIGKINREYYDDNKKHWYNVQFNCYHDYYDNHCEICEESAGFETSPNIIDLIEVGDYVDRLRVVDKYEDYIVVETFDERIVINKEDTIKSVLTKEQFESMEYKIND